MNKLNSTFAKITEVIKANTPENLKINWKREGNVFTGTTQETCEGMTTLKVNLRKNTLKEAAREIQLALNAIQMDCDYIASLIPTEHFYIRMTVKNAEKDFSITDETVKEKTVKAPKEKTAKAEKGPGVIATILAAIQEGPQTQASIIDKLVFTFPERDLDSMKKTVAAQIGSFKKQPTRMEREKNVQFLITVDDKGIPTYAIAK